MRLGVRHSNISAFKERKRFSTENIFCAFREVNVCKYLLLREITSDYFKVKSQQI